MAREQVVIGVVAGATPLLVNLVNVEAGVIFAQWDWLVFCGYMIKAVALMGLAGIVVYVNGESHNWKAFQLGIMAPALVVGFLNGQKVDALTKDLAVTKTLTPTRPRDEPSNGKGVSLKPERREFALISSAHAESLPKGLHRDSTNADKVLFGFTGYSTNNWFVIVGSYFQQRNARAQEENLKKIGYDARVYDPNFSRTKYYAVAIGSNLSLDEAEKIREQAVRDGLPSDTYITRFQP